LAQQAGRHLYRSGEVVQILGISRRQLQYWAQTDLVRPTVQTQGGHYRYRFEDLVALKAAKRLIDAGISVQRIRTSIRALKKILPKVRKPLAELVLVATGDVVLAFREGTAFETVSGQEWVLEVAQFEREIETWRRKNEAPSGARARRATSRRSRSTQSRR
jgi:DNA-binding transcriptional MerR regulator